MVLSVYTDAIDGMVWRCTKCRSRVTIRKHSILMDSKLTLPQFLIFLFLWSRQTKVCDIREELSIASDTASLLCSKMARACDHWYKLTPRKIGGLGHTVQIDETQLSRKKHDKGRAVPGSDVWIFIWRRSVKARNVDIFDASLRLLASATGDKVPW